MSIIRPTLSGPRNGAWPRGNLIASIAWMNKAWQSQRLASVRSLVLREASKPQNQAAINRLLSGGGPEARETLATWMGLGLPIAPQVAQNDPEIALIAGVATGRIPVTNPQVPRTTGRRPDPNDWRPSAGLRVAEAGVDAVLPGGSQILRTIAHAVDNELPFDEAFKNVLRSIPGFGVVFGLVDDFVTWLGRELGIGESDAERREREWREWLAEAPQRLEEYARQWREAQEMRRKAQQIRERLARDPAFADSFAGYKAEQDAASMERDARLIEDITRGKIEAEEREADYARQLDEERADPMKRVERHAKEMAQQQARHEGAIERGYDIAKKAGEIFDKASERYGAEAAELEKWAKMARARARDRRTQNEAIIDSLRAAGQYREYGPGADPSMGIEDNELRRDYQANRREARAYEEEAQAWEERAQWLREKERRARKREQEAQRQATRNQRKAAEQVDRAGIIARLATGQGTPQDYQRLSADPSLQREFQEAMQAVAETAPQPQRVPPTQPGAVIQPTQPRPRRQPTQPRPSQQPTQPVTVQQTIQQRFQRGRQQVQRGAQQQPITYQLPQQPVTPPPAQQTPVYFRMPEPTQQAPAQQVSLPPINIPAPVDPEAYKRQLTIPMDMTLPAGAQLTQQQLAQLAQQQQVAPVTPCAGVDPAARMPNNPGYWCTQWSGFGESATCVQFIDNCLDPRVKAPPAAPAAPATPTYSGYGGYTAPSYTTPRRGRGPATTPATSIYRGGTDLL